MMKFIKYAGQYKYKVLIKWSRLHTRDGRRPEFLEPAQAKL